MKKTTTYAVIDTVIGTIVGNGLDDAEVKECLFLNKLGCSEERFAVFEETPDLVKYLYDLAATLHEEGQEAWNMGDNQGADLCKEDSAKLLEVASELEELYGEPDTDGGDWQEEEVYFCDVCSLHYAVDEPCPFH